MKQQVTKGGKNKAKLKKVVKGLKKASKSHAKQAKTLQTIKLGKGGSAKKNPQSTRQVTIPNLPCVRICLVGSRQVVKEASPVSGVLVKLRCLPNNTKLRVVATNNG